MGLKSPHFEKYSLYIGFSIGVDIISTPPKNDLRPFGKRSVLWVYLVSTILTLHPYDVGDIIPAPYDNLRVACLPEVAVYRNSMLDLEIPISSQISTLV